MSFDVRAIIESHPQIQQLGLREREVAVGVLEGAVATVEPVVRGLVTERDRYRQALEAARDALADPNALAELTDSPANMAFAILNHALAASDEPTTRDAAPLGEKETRV